MWCIVLAVIVLGAVAWSQIVSNVDQQKYMVVQSLGDTDIRHYATKKVAKGKDTADRKTKNK